MDSTFAPMTYAQWLNTLDSLTQARTGRTLYALPERNYAPAYEYGLTPEEYFDTALVDAFAGIHAATSSGQLAFTFVLAPATAGRERRVTN